MMDIIFQCKTELLVLGHRLFISGLGRQVVQHGYFTVDFAQFSNLTLLALPDAKAWAPKFE
ncbi:MULTISPECIES: hypothetical protein [unclassified Rhizobium]|uniref:hypothetical protein n=1 Tax=unclassified Rhizobium TaxID=2613769 RepID=UPI00160FC342|nr:MULTISPECIES: hypothetical protein [unclassified Rhizobium]MBB3320251.1 hypothetical protein [Rhizobium sp. BK181]MBB3543469.1 hypothetical protein [Rhizobium sp. BK399]MCS3742697.1 hypothetical protein [Rhizobium sp. BK661]MCS4096007.1 hypothetical protein [Rhizobium sp. BK176]